METHKARSAPGHSLMNTHKKHARWFLGELPELVSENIISKDSADQLRQHYGEHEHSSGNQIAFALFSILAAVLIGSGIILLLAHNWDEFSRFTRAILSLAPLIVAQALAGWGLWKQKESLAWREGATIFLMLAMGSSLALICQTYNLSDDPNTFTLTWLLLSLPLAYLFRASIVVIFYLGGIISWAALTRTYGGDIYFFWLLLALTIPHLQWAGRNRPYGGRAILLRWAFIISLSSGIGIVMADALSQFWIIIYSSLFAILYLTGSIWFRAAPRLLVTQPFRLIGAAGMFLVSWLFTFQWPWKELDFSLPTDLSLSDDILVAVLPIAVIILLFFGRRKLRGASIYSGAIPILAILGYVLSGLKTDPLTISLIFNLYLFILGLWVLVSGIKKRSIGNINLGMFILGVLILTRFFDSNLSFITRGVSSIVIGIGFLTTNLILLRRNRGNDR